MKKFAITALATGALILTGGCAKTVTSGLNDLNKKYFDAWIQINHPDASETELGAYILSDSPGDGEMVGGEEDMPFVYCTFTLTDLEGNISSTTDMLVSQQVGTYSQENYYGPRILTRKEGYLSAGVSDVLSTMRVGGTRTVAIPGWLNTTNRYDKASDYLAKENESDGIYTISVKEAIPDITEWEIDSLARWMNVHYPGVDSVSYGYYYIQTKAPVDTNSFASDDCIYIDYTGRLLNGTVFDTSVKDSAKLYRLYTDGTTYEPSELTWSEDDEITFESGSSMISGFEQCIRNMKTAEEGICIFYSGLGYSVSGSGNTIPPFSPLIFNIRMWGEDTDESNDVTEE